MHVISLYHPFAPFLCRGSEQASPRWATLVCELFGAEGNEDLAGSQETSAFLPLHCPEEYELGALPMVRDIRDDLF